MQFEISEGNYSELNTKIIVLIAYTLVFAYGMLLIVIKKRSCSNPIPDNVKDVYDAETYGKWRLYTAEKLKVSVFSHVVNYAAGLILFASNAYAWSAGLWSGSVYTELIAVMLFSQLTDLVIVCVFEYIDDMIIEQKYGFNRMTLKTFIGDRIKGLLISTLLLTLIVCALTAIYRALGDWVILLFTGVVTLLALGITFLYPYFTRLFNKFTELEEGELRDKLTKLLEKNGYKVRGIKVMDASKRSSKSNAYFAGFGKTKTIVLYDTLISGMTTDEICAVFAHELGHGLHKDTTKMQLMSLINMFIMALVIWLTLKWDALYPAFGFEGINYTFAFIVSTSIGLGIVSPAFGLLTNWYSRRAEFLADAQAVEEGYGETLKSALKKLTRENFGHLAPSKLLVRLTASHPPVSERLDAIDKLSK